MNNFDKIWLMISQADLTQKSSGYDLFFFPIDIKMNKSVNQTIK